MPRPNPAVSRPHGFTIVELMIAVLVVAILAAVAYPSYMDAIRKGRRSDAFSALALAMQAQERYRTNHTAYSESLTDLGLAANSPDGLYAVSIVSGSASATAYTLQASARSGYSQTSDTTCRTLQVAVSSGNIVYSSLNSAAAVNTSAPDPCWAR